MFKKTLAFTFLSILLGLTLMACLQNEKTDPKALYLQKQKIWVDSVMNTMTQDEKLGQLFSIKTFSNRTEAHYREVENLIQNYHVGGLSFFQGFPVVEAKLTNRFQKLAKIPLMIAIDGEWGLEMRLEGTMQFPYQMTLGAIPYNQLIYEMGVEIGEQCKRIGIHVNFAPSIDVNNNPKNPVIHYRSFGEDKRNVSEKALAYTRGMQDKGVLACAKHFPGHGDTDQDSHLTLPKILHNRQRLDSLELYPFRQLIQNEVKSMMVAHLEIPALESTKNLPTTLSKKVVTDLLQEELGYKGLIFTDALSMAGVTMYYPPGDVDVRALKAGNDVLLIPSNVPVAIKAIKKAIKKGELTWEAIDKKVQKILEAKYFAGLHQYKPIELKNINQDLHTPKAKVLQEKLYASAMTLVKNEDNILPIVEPQKYTYASVALGAKKQNNFQNMLDNYAKLSHFQILDNANSQTYTKVLNEASKAKVVFVSLHNLSYKSKANFGINTLQRDFIKKLQAKTKVVLTVFGTPYSLKFFEDSKHLICAYEENEIVQNLVPQMIFGARRFVGKLPVSASPKLKVGTGVLTQAYAKLKYSSLPETVHMNSQTFAEVDKIIKASIQQKMMPGCQFLVARQGTVVWNKSYGFQTYSNQKAIDNQMLYDVASITKVLGTLQAIQYLYQKKKLNLDAKISQYLPEVASTNKKDITVREVLTHQAGLIPYIPFWKQTMTGNQRSSEYYSPTKSAKYPHSVAKGIYSQENMENILWGWSMESDRIKKESKGNHYQYKYSDMSFYILKRIAEKLLNEPIEDFLYREIYEPLGVETCYNPLDSYEVSRIPPTEKDTYFRFQTVQGHVHDQGASMLGGVGGHAGLFSSANDLAVLMQLQLQKGLYGKTQFFEPEVIETFTKKQYKHNRRGLGWDKKDQEPSSYMPSNPSKLAYGHSGFTGCVVWADPENELLVVFLSNRIHPSAENRKAITTKLRNKVMNILYEGIGK